jgi:dTDP-4-amino-4,6-dideoxygalactose transaminase
MRKQIGVGDLQLTDFEKRYVNQVLDSNRLSYGPFTERFEAEFARLHECRRAIFCNSGTSAPHVALAALKERDHGIEPGVVSDRITPRTGAVIPIHVCGPQRFERYGIRRRLLG